MNNKLKISVYSLVSLIFFGLIIYMNYLDIYNYSKSLYLYLVCENVSILGIFYILLLYELTYLLPLEENQFNVCNLVSAFLIIIILLNIVIVGAVVLLFNLFKGAFLSWGIHLLLNHPFMWYFLPLIIFDGIITLLDVGFYIGICYLLYKWYMSQAQMKLKNQNSYQYLQKFFYKGEEPNQDDCSICLDELGKEYVVLVCRHPFHIGCIDQWFKESAAATCPYCKKEYLADITGTYGNEAIDLDVDVGNTNVVLNYINVEQNDTQQQTIDNFTEDSMEYESESENENEEMDLITQNDHIFRGCEEEYPNPNYDLTKKYDNYIESHISSELEMVTPKNHFDEGNEVNTVNINNNFEHRVNNHYKENQKIDNIELKGGVTKEYDYNYIIQNENNEIEIVEDQL